ncbi:MAG: hypothetical protein ACK55Z_37245 [bacterium]
MIRPATTFMCCSKNSPVTPAGTVRLATKRHRNFATSMARK